MERKSYRGEKEREGGPRVRARGGPGETEKATRWPLVRLKCYSPRAVLSKGSNAPKVPIKRVLSRASVRVRSCILRLSLFLSLCRVWLISRCARARVNCKRRALSHKFFRETVIIGGGVAGFIAA